jgi:hypothetical protein
MSISVSASKTSDAAITCLTGGCHCGAVSYELPLPPSIDLESPDISKLYKDNSVAPSKQRFAARGGKPTQNKWRASHCHCGACRRTVGALMVDWVNIPSKDIVITRKGPTGKHRASNHASREFVSICIPYTPCQHPHRDLIISSAKRAGHLCSSWTTTTQTLST